MSPIQTSEIVQLKDEHSYEDWKGTCINHLRTVDLLKYVEDDIKNPDEAKDAEIRA